MLGKLVAVQVCAANPESIRDGTGATDDESSNEDD